MATAKKKTRPGTARLSRAGRGRAGRLSTEDVILDTAQTLFARYGYDGVSTKQLASEAGLTIGALYHYFSGKEAIYCAATRRAFAAKAALPPSIRNSTEAAEPKLARLAAWFVSSITTDKNFGMLMQRELLDPRADTKLLMGNDQYREAIELFKSLLRELLPKADLDEALSSMLALVFGLSSLKSIVTLAPTLRTKLATPAEIGTHATSLLLRGLRGG